MLLALLLSAGLLPAIPLAPPTFCAEWVRQSSSGYERLTLFADGTLVWKRNETGVDILNQKRLTQQEFEFYRSYFGRREFWSLPGDLRAGRSGRFGSESSLTLTRPDGSRKEVRFDDRSSLPPEATALRAALEGLKGIFLAELPPASRFTPETLAPGTLLKRRDGAVFRVRRVEEKVGIVEIVGVSEPYSQFVKIEDLRFQFFPPE